MSKVFNKSFQSLLSDQRTPTRMATQTLMKTRMKPTKMYLKSPLRSQLAGI